VNIYFHVDELNRDAVVASALKKKFARLGHTLVYGNRVTNRLLKYHHRTFDVVVVPRPHMLYDHWGDEWMSWDVRFAMLSSESLGIICRDHRVMARTLLEKDYFEGNRTYVDRIDAFCLWGPKQLQAIKDYAPEIATKCHVVGHPRHDASCVRAQDAGRQRPRRRIGVITRAVALNDYFRRSALDGFTTLFDEHFQYEFVNKTTGERLKSKRPGAQPADVVLVQAIDTENTLKIINRLESAGYTVSVRVHPKENAEIWQGLLKRCRLHAQVAEARMPIARWLEGVDYLVGPPSTSFYDAVMLGVTPISICQLDARRRQSIGELWEDNNRLMEHVFRPDTIDSLVEYIARDTRYVHTPASLQVLQEEAYYPACASSLDKVVAVCTASVPERSRGDVRLVSFELARYLYFKAWRARLRAQGRRENSAMFVMGREERRFVDGLTSTA
jgi:surface carbohydrate biosynthesis protein